MNPNFTGIVSQQKTVTILPTTLVSMKSAGHEPKIRSMIQVMGDEFQAVLKASPGLFQPRLIGERMVKLVFEMDSEIKTDEVGNVVLAHYAVQGNVSVTGEMTTVEGDIHVFVASCSLNEADGWRNTIRHELAHVANRYDILADSHGPEWQKYAARLGVRHNFHGKVTSAHN